MSAHKIVDRPAPEAHVTCSIVHGGETVNSAHMDAAILGPRDGRFETVWMRVFRDDGEGFEFRFDPADLRQALELVEELRAEGFAR